MKKTAFLLTLLLLVSTLVPILTMGASLPLRIIVNGARVNSDVAAFTDGNNRAQVPIRFVSQALKAKVDWNQSTKVVTVEQGTKKILLTVGKKAYTVNGQTKQMDTVATLKQGRTFVPIRFVSEALGASVNWNQSTNTVNIDTTGTGAESPKEEVIHDFTIVHDTGSQLEVDNGSYDELGKTYSLFSMFINLGKTGADYNKQVEEVEAILLQKVKKDTVDSIIRYVKNKTQREQSLASKTFTDDKYEVFVVSRENSFTIEVAVFYK